MNNQIRAMNEKDFVEAQQENVFQAGVVKLEKERGINMSDITPQAGDVWKWTGLENETLKVIGVGSYRVLVSSDAGREDMCNISRLVEQYTLIERDGKPYVPEREFELGAFYPVLHKGKKDIVKYLWSGYFCMTGCDEEFKAHDLKIGPKLKIDWDWAEVENE